MFTVERIAWSIAKGRYAYFRLTYSHVYVPERNFWRDFLVQTEELQAVA